MVHQVALHDTLFILLRLH